MVKNFDATWLHLTPDEEVLWAGHPSVYRVVPSAATGVVLALVGIGLAGAGVFAPANWLPLLLIPIALLVALPSYLRWRGEWYVLTTEEVYHKYGVFSKSVTQVRLDRVQNTACSQSMVERVFDYGDVTLYTAGSGTVDLVFEDVSDPQQLNSILTEQLDRVSTVR